MNAPRKRTGFFTDPLAARDPEIARAIGQELGRQRDEIEKSLLMARLDIAERYAALVSERETAEAVFGMIAADHRRSVGAVEAITGQPLGARFPNLRARIARNEIPLQAAHAAQIALLQRVRADGEHSERIRLMQTMNCISAGLGWTG